MPTTENIDLKQIADLALAERGLRTSFSEAAVREAEKATEPDFSQLKVPDLSKLPWSSIDNDDSRDLDQVEYVKVEGDVTRVLVGIADVASLVAPGSPLDQDAQHNTTSVYTGVETYPMLPERLSTDLTSLNESKKRLAVVIETVLSKEGEVQSFSVYPAIVENKAQLTYDAVSTWLGDNDSPHSEITKRMLDKIRENPALQEQLRLQDEIAQTLRQRRYEEGALEFRTQQLRPSIDPDGRITLQTHEPNRATQLIEELMVAANQAVDEFLEQNGSPVLQRIVRTPENWERMVELARQHGGRLPKHPDGQALQRFLAEQRRRDPERFPDLSLAMIKLMGRGEYDIKRVGEDGVGHFGLAVSHYAHSTAPNRRYPDLITQRLLHAVFAGEPPPYSPKELHALARRCTEMEDAANKSERQVHKSMAALAMETRIGEKFPGFITGASEKGVWVRIANPPVEGKVQGNTRGLKVGQKVEVELVSTDVERGFIDFEVVRRGR